jgi:hypothetical protein
VSPHRELFNAYIAELRVAMAAATAWWETLIARETARLGSRAAAEQEVRQRWLFGPASHPRIIAVYRKYYIACERLNDRLEAADPAGDAGEESESDWGTDSQEPSGEAISDDEFWDDEGPIDPPILLRDALSGRADDLDDFMAFFVYSSIGEENDQSV